MLPRAPAVGRGPLHVAEQARLNRPVCSSRRGPTPRRRRARSVRYQLSRSPGLQPHPAPCWGRPALTCCTLDHPHFPEAPTTPTIPGSPFDAFLAWQLPAMAMPDFPQLRRPAEEYPKLLGVPFGQLLKPFERPPRLWLPRLLPALPARRSRIAVVARDETCAFPSSIRLTLVADHRLMIRSPSSGDCGVYVSPSVKGWPPSGGS